MGRETRKTALPAVGKSAKTRHQNQGHRIAQADPAVYSTLNALKQAPKLNHKSHFEIFDNVDKKAKKLETQVTSNRVPPPGYEFVALGNPDLSALCKDLSREQDAMIFIVSESKDQSVHSQTHRLGWHFRERIVDRARQDLLADGRHEPQKLAITGRPEAIPSDRLQMMNEADAVLRDLFPRIPNISRMEILRHSFDKDNKFFNGKEKVGMAGDLSLARRVQLAALSHIRHTMTRYDALLREGQKWENARKAVEKPCLDIIVKWRGDEETGRDQLDEILREVIEISDDEDSEDPSSEEEHILGPSGGRVRDSVPPSGHVVATETRLVNEPAHAQSARREPSVVCLSSSTQPRKPTRKERKAAKQTQQRFKRYAQVAEGFRHEPNVSAPSQNDPLGRNVPMPSQLRSAPEGERVLWPLYQQTQQSQPFVEPADGASRLRGQSPVLVRIAVSNGSKVGQPPIASSHYSTIPLSPVKHQYQDMLVPSIEPRSPGVQRTHGRMPLYPEQGSEPARIMRTIYEQPNGMAHPGSPFRSSGATGAVPHRQRLATQPGEHSDLFFGAGFIQVHREPERRVTTHEYMNKRPRSNVIPVTTEPFIRIRDPAVYVEEPARVDQGDASYRPRVNPVHIGEPAYQSRGGIALRTRDHPILLDSTPVVNRIVDTQNRMDVGQTLQRGSEVLHGAPLRNMGSGPDRSNIIYVDDPTHRFVQVHERQPLRRSRSPVFDPSGLHHTPTLMPPYYTEYIQSSRNPHPAGRLAEYRPEYRPDFQGRTDRHIPEPNHLPSQPTHQSVYPPVGYQNTHRTQPVTIHEAGREYIPVQHSYSNPGDPPGGGNYY